MTKIEVLEALKQMTVAERLEIIEIASKLIRDELAEQPESGIKELSLTEATEVMRPYHEQV